MTVEPEPDVIVPEVVKVVPDRDNTPLLASAAPLPILRVVPVPLVERVLPLAIVRDAVFDRARLFTVVALEPNVKGPEPVSCKV